jgi:hypothetical protein
VNRKHFSPILSHSDETQNDRSHFAEHGKQHLARVAPGPVGIAWFRAAAQTDQDPIDPMTAPDKSHSAPSLLHLETKKLKLRPLELTKPISRRILQKKCDASQDTFTALTQPP